MGAKHSGQKYEGPPVRRVVFTRRAQESKRRMCIRLGNQGEHRVYIGSAEIGACTVQQAIVEHHYAAIRVLSAVAQVVKNGFSPRAAA